jgi:hypothetical protein
MKTRPTSFFSRSIHFALVAGILFINLPVSAQLVNQGSQIQEIMKKMSPIFETLSNTTLHHSTDAQSIQQWIKQDVPLTQDLNALIQQAIALCPESVSELSADQQQKQFAVYQKMLRALSTAVVALGTAITNNDQTAAQDALNKMSDLQQKGHQQFAD